MKKAWIYIIPVVLIIGLVALSLSLDPPEKRQKQAPTYSKAHNHPYGSQVVYSLMQDLFSGDFMTVNEPTYNVFSDTIFEKKSAYIVVNGRYLPDQFDVDYLTDFVEEGNYAFLAASYMSRPLLDTLGGLQVEANAYFYENVDTLPPSFVSAELNPDTANAYDFSKPNMRGYFSIKPWKAQTIAEMGIQNDSTQIKPILLFYPYGKGGFILSSTPLLFTNYQILNAENQDFIAKAMSFIPKDVNIIWDEYYKAENLAGLSNNNSGGGLFSYIRSQPGLSTAWSIFLFGLLFYIISELKRKQRIVPVIKSLPNATLEFTQTIGQLYYSRQDHKSIGQKKIKVWMEYVRSRYYLKTDRLDGDFVEKLSAKSGVQGATIAQILKHNLRLNKQADISESTLIDLSVLVESFYEKSLR
ncbi:MAG: DUF4350 domain-containing protein [Bacteroidia bacterium]